MEKKKEIPKLGFPPNPHLLGTLIHLVGPFASALFKSSLGDSTAHTGERTIDLPLSTFTEGNLKKSFGTQVVFKRVIGGGGEKEGTEKVK